MLSSTYPLLRKSFRSLACVTGSQETYTRYGASSCANARRTVTPNPVRGGSTTIKSGFAEPARRDQVSREVVMQRPFSPTFFFQADLTLLSWSIPITSSYLSARNAPNKPTPPNRSSASFPLEFDTGPRTNSTRSARGKRFD